MAAIGALRRVRGWLHRNKALLLLVAMPGSSGFYFAAVCPGRFAKEQPGVGVASGLLVPWLPQKEGRVQSCRAMTDREECEG